MMANVSHVAVIVYAQGMILQLAWLSLQGPFIEALSAHLAGAQVWRLAHYGAKLSITFMDLHLLTIRSSELIRLI